MVTKHGKVELPLHVMVDAANACDAVMGAEALVRLLLAMKLHLPEAAIAHGIFDAGYDATSFHRLLVRLGAKPVIALNERNFKPRDEHGVERDAQGVPLCKGGAPMRFHCHNKRTGKMVYNCPAKRPTRALGIHGFATWLEDCPLGCLCEPDSTMGPLVNLSVEEDPRLNPPLPRHSDQFREQYAKRTATERWFSWSKEAKGLGARPYRRRALFHLHATLLAIHSHALAWVDQELKGSRPDSWDALMELLRRWSGEDRVIGAGSALAA